MAGLPNLYVTLGACGITKFERIFRMETAEQLARLLLLYDAHVISRNRRMTCSY